MSGIYLPTSIDKTKQKNIRRGVFNILEPSIYTKKKDKTGRTCEKKKIIIIKNKDKEEGFFVFLVYRKKKSHTSINK